MIEKKENSKSVPNITRSSVAPPNYKNPVF